MKRRIGSVRGRLAPAVAARWAATCAACAGGWRRAASDQAKSAQPDDKDAELTLDPRVASAYAALPQAEVASNLDERQLALPNLFDARDFPRFMTDAPQDAEDVPESSPVEAASGVQMNEPVAVDEPIEPAEPIVRRFNASALRSSAEFEIAAASAVVVGLIVLVLAMASLMMSKPEPGRDLAAEIAQRRAELPQFRAPAPCAKRPCPGPQSAPASAAPPPQSAPPATTAVGAQPGSSAAPAPVDATPDQSPAGPADFSAPGIVVDPGGTAAALSNSAMRSSLTDWVMSAAPDAASAAAGPEASLANDPGAMSLEWQSAAPADPTEPQSLPNFAGSASAKKSIATTGRAVRKRAAAKRAARRVKPSRQTPPAAVAQQPAAPPETEEAEAKPQPPKLGSSKWPTGWSLWPTQPKEPAEPAPSFGFGGN